MSRSVNLELTDEQTERLIRELSEIIQNDRYPLSPRIVALKEILGMLLPEPAREPLPPRRYYELPSKGRYSRDEVRPLPSTPVTREWGEGFASQNVAVRRS
jgi:hypothetical protein